MPLYIIPDDLVLALMEQARHLYYAQYPPNIPRHTQFGRGFPTEMPEINLQTAHSLLKKAICAIFRVKNVICML